MMRRLALLVSALAPLFAWAQNYGANTIPDDLTRGANAVVRHYAMEYDLKSKTSATEKHTIVVTILGQGGEDAAELYIFTDDIRGLKSFSGEILDRTGFTLRKIKRSDLKISELSSGLADDSKVYYYEPHVPSYPYTVKYTYEISHRGGIIFFPTFVPVTLPDMSLEEASYTLRVPAGSRIHTRNVNTDIRPEKSSGAGQDTYVWSAANLRPIVTEPYGRTFGKLMPSVYVNPHEFSYNGTDGIMDTWENYAKWQWCLLEKRQTLPPALRDEIARMTAGASTDMEKIRILYDYLAATTRYVSIQIGIGGLQPMTAEQVYNRKFGDCKALSNYMGAMLAECGIPSFYVEIGVSDRDIIPDYVSPLLSNHAILAVPQQDGEILWLECTSPELPLGFVHEGIAGQHALIYKDGTAYIRKVPVYPDSLHLSTTEGRIAVAADGSMKGHVSRTDAYNRYVNRFAFGKMDARERVNYLQKEINLQLTEISNIVFTEDKTSAPSCATSFDISKKPQSGDVTGRLFLESSPFRKSPTANLGRSGRKTDIVIESGFRNLDIVVIEPDAGFGIEALPPPQNIETKYGKFMQMALPVDGNIVITRLFQLNTGEYTVSEYADFKRFIDAVQAGYTARIVLKKKS